MGTLLGSPAAHGLFQRAIAQSGHAHGGMSLEAARQVAAIFSDLSGVPATPEAVGALPIGRLLEIEEELGAGITTQRFLDRAPAMEATSAKGAYQPVWGTDVLPERPIDGIRSGMRAVSTCSWVPRPMSSGSSPPSPKRWDFRPTAIFLEAPSIRSSRPSLPHRVETPPPSSRPTRRNRPDASVLDLMLAVGTDGWNRIPAIRLAEAQLAHGPVFFYRFDWPSPANGGRMGACHALELPFVFETVDCATAIALTRGAAPPALVAATHAAWVAFATTGDPSCAQLPRWPAYDIDSRPTMCLDLESARSSMTRSPTRGSSGMGCSKRDP